MAKPTPLLSITSTDFLKGSSINRDIPNTPLALSSGWSIYRYGVVGTLRPNTSPVDLDSDQSHLDSNILSMVPRGDGYIYMMAANGDMFKFHNTSSSIGASEVLRNDNAFTGSDGLEFFKPQGGTEYMFYWNGSQIGRWDISGTYPTGWTDNHFTGLQSTNIHPTHKFFGAVYYGNKDRVGKVYDNSGTAANNTNVLDFESDYTVYDITDDGTYLVITINNGEHTKLIFWDTFSPSWNKEYTIYDPSIIPCLQRQGNYIWGRNAWGTYRFNFNEPPQKIYLETSGSTLAGRSNTKGLLGGLVLLGALGGISSYGSYTEQLPPARFTPFYVPTQSSQQTSAILVYSEQTILLASNGHLYKFESTGNGADVDIDLFTSFVNLNATYDIKKIEILIGTSTFDTCEVRLYKERDYTYPYLFTTYTHSNEQKMTFYPDWSDANTSDSNLHTNTIGLKITFKISQANSDVHVKGINVYGEPIDSTDVPVST